MADKKAATAAAQTQSDKPKKNDGAKKVSFFGKVKNFFKGIGKYFKDTKSELKRSCGPARATSRPIRSPLSWSWQSQLSC